MSALVRPWLLAQGALLLLGVLTFGLLFPLIGLAIVVVGAAPGGEDPLGVGLGIALSGVVTAVIYLPGATLALLAARNLRTDPQGAFTLVLLAGICGGVVCPLALAPVVLYLLGRDGAASATP
jgi:hypothetical protein